MNSISARVKTLPVGLFGLQGIIARVFELNTERSSSGSKVTTYFNDRVGQNGTETNDYRAQVTSKWMASALLRAGILLNEQTLVYGMGGWTVAQFELRDGGAASQLDGLAVFRPVETFVANGWTAGACCSVVTTSSEERFRAPFEACALKPGAECYH